MALQDLLEETPLFLMHGFHRKGKFGWHPGMTVLAPEVSVLAVPRADLAQAWQCALQRLGCAQQCQKATYDAPILNPLLGWETVMILDLAPKKGKAAKLQPPFKGPYIITQVYGQNCRCSPLGGVPADDIHVMIKKSCP